MCSAPYLRVDQIIHSLYPLPHFFMQSELLRTFNCGVGMVLVVSPENEIKVLQIIRLTVLLYRNLWDLALTNLKDSRKPLTCCLHDRRSVSEPCHQLHFLSGDGAINSCRRGQANEVGSPHCKGIQEH